MAIRDDAVQSAERALNEAVDNAKRLKAKAREARQQHKQAKKAAKKAAKAARAARKASETARRAYKKAIPRADKAARMTSAGPARVAKAAGDVKAVVARRKAPRRRVEKPRRPEPPPGPPGVDFDVAFTAADLAALESR